MLVRSPLLASLLVCSLNAQVVISEALVTNRTGSTDRDGNTADWIELHNAGDATLSLAGHYLSDARDKPRRWRLPDVDLPSGGYLVVFASGKDRDNPRRPLHTNFRLGDGDEAVVLVAPDGETVVAELDLRGSRADVSVGHPQAFDARTWIARDATARILVPREDDDRLPTATEFDDGGWEEAAGPFGFDVKSEPTLQDAFATDLREAMRGKSSGLYARWTFDVPDPKASTVWALRIQFETGFVAHVNGHRIARRRAPSKPDADAAADPGLEPRDPFKVEQFELRDAHSLLEAGTNVLAIHSLTESPNSLEHYLAVELVGYRADPIDTSRRVFFAEPSPGRPNGNGLPTTLGLPTIEPAGATFEDAVEVTLRAPDDAATLRYTLDGSEPDASSPTYTAPFAVRDTRMLRVRAFRADACPSPIASAGFARLDPDLADFSSNLPIVVVSTAGATIRPKNYVDAHARIVTPGDDGRASFRGTAQYAGCAGIKTRGSSSLERPKKSYGLQLRDLSGESRPAALCGMPKDADWVLYGPHNWDQSHLRNALCYRLARAIGLDAPRTHFVELFVNQEQRPVRRSDYMGLYILVERITRGRHRIDVEELTPRHDAPPQIHGGYILKIDRPGPGDMGFESGGQRLQFVYPKERDITDPQRRWLIDHFAKFGKALGTEKPADPKTGYPAFIDVDSWIDYHFYQEYMKNPDAFTLSTYLYKRRRGKLRMGPVWDCDRSMRTNDREYWVGRPASTDGWTRDREYGWWKPLLSDAEFWGRYRARGRDWLNGELSTERVHAVVDELAAQIAEAEERDRMRWPIIRAGGWDEEILRLKRWIAERTEWMQDEFVDVATFEASSKDYVFPFDVTLRHSNDDGEIWYTTDGADPRLSDGTVSARAKRYTGPIPVTDDVHIHARVRVGDRWSRPTDRWYVRNLMKLAISEVMYNPPGGRNYEFIEFRNWGDEPIDLHGIRLAGRIEFYFATGDVSTVAPGECVVVVRDRVKFAERYDVTNIRVAGEFWGRMSNTRSELKLLGPVDEELAKVVYQDDWFAETDGKGHSLVARKATRAVLNKGDWRASRRPLGTPGR